MKKIAVFLIAASLVVVSGCSAKPEKSILKEGTPVYQLVKELSAKVPQFDPQKNITLVRTKKFEIAVGDVAETIMKNLGKNLDRLKGRGAEELKTIFSRMAAQIAENRILLDEAVKAGVTVPPADLDNVLKVQYEKNGGEKAFLDKLAENGIALDTVKKGLSDQLLLSRYFENNVFKTIVATDAEIAKAYGEDKTASVRHILLMTEGKNAAEKAEIHKKIEGILARAKAGEDFAALAKECSEDTGSKDNGGLYENFGRGQMVKPFEDACFSVSPGQISGIVETQFGYHIIQVVERKKETRPLAEAKSDIEAAIKGQKQGALYNDLMTRVKKESGFEVVAK